MDYEKAYNEALERAKKVLLDCTSEERKAVEYAFPELAESEDERIRKFFVELITDNESIQLILKGRDIEINNALNWLEKQKVNTDGDFARGYDCGYEINTSHYFAEYAPF